MTNLYRKKPIVIEAHQVPEEGQDCTEEMTEFLNQSDRDIESIGRGSLLIHTLEGAMEAKPLDWIIKGVSGEYYPCKPDIFEQIYEKVSDE